jgi:hypothetical protein
MFLDSYRNCNVAKIQFTHLASCPSFVPIDAPVAPLQEEVGHPVAELLHLVTVFSPLTFLPTSCSSPPLKKFGTGYLPTTSLSLHTIYIIATCSRRTIIIKSDPFVVTRKHPGPCSRPTCYVILLFSTAEFFASVF